MAIFDRKSVVLPILSLLCSAEVLAQEVEKQENEGPKTETTSERVEVKSTRLKRASNGATGLDLSIYDTPQSVVSFDREYMDSFAFDDVTSALRFANGVNVESVETDRTSFFSRGFEVKHMQVDGINIPFQWNLSGSLDTSIYERMEVVRGANGLLTGTGAPSGTINFIRKRPKDYLQAGAEITLNSFKGSRFEGDVSVPLTEDGRWAARVVGTISDERSHIDNYENDRNVLYGIIEGQLLDNLVVAAGYIDQKSDSKNPLWGAMPTIFSDGSQTDYDVSASQSMDWSFWNTGIKTGFLEFNYAFTENWILRATGMNTNYKQKQETIWYSGLPDRETGLGLSGYPGAYGSKSDTTEIDVAALGKVTLFGRDHDLQVGFSHSKAKHKETNRLVPETDPIWGPAPAIGKGGYEGNEVPRPPFGPVTNVGDWDHTLVRHYGSARINPHDDFKLILGFSHFEEKMRGEAYGDPMNATESELGPYAGLIWSGLPATNVYASYSEIFEPQTELNERSKPIGPAKGTNYELGAKTEVINDTLMIAAALFRADQKNLSEFVRVEESTGKSLYRGSDIKSKGFEIDVSGKVRKDISVLAGYSQMKVEEADGIRRKYLPESSIKLLSTWTLNHLWTLGGSARWQDVISYTHAETSKRVSQEGYTVLGANASYNWGQHATISLIVDNLTDEKYHNSLYWADIYSWNQSFYGAPRNAKLVINMRW